MDEEKKELLKKIFSITLIIVIIAATFFYLHAPPGPLKSTNIKEYQNSDWEKYATPFFSFYTPPKYTISNVAIPQQQASITIKMPDNHPVLTISYFPHAVTGKNKFSIATPIPKSKFSSGYINNYKVWIYDNPIPNGQIVAIFEKDRQSITATGTYYDTSGTLNGISFLQQRKTLIRIIESIRFSGF